MSEQHLRMNDNLMSRHDMGVLMNSALNDRFALEEAIQRVRELAEYFNNQDEDKGFYGFYIASLIGKALDGEQA